MYEDILVEMSRIMRECEQAVLEKIKARQHGELFADIEGERNDEEDR